MTDKITLLDYQEEGLKWCMENEDKCCILAYDMGLGKTIITCELLNRKRMKTIVIVPSCILSQWMVELNKHTEGLNIVLYHGSNRLRMRKSCEDADIIVTTSHVIANDILEKAKFLKNIKRWVIDEAHQMRNMKSKVYKCLHSYASNIENKVFLTGTPICNNVSDLISLICLSNIEIYNNVKFWKQKNESEKMVLLTELCPNVLLRRTKANTIQGLLPSITFEDIKINMMEGEQKQVYNSFINDNILIRRILRMRQSLNNHKNITEEDKKLVDGAIKIETVNKLLSKIDKEDKIIIFSFFSSLLYQLYDEIELGDTIDRKAHIKIYNGTMNSKDRNSTIDDYKKADGARILLINLRAGGCGLNLTEANHVILMEPYWNESEQEQAFNRVYRLGQKKAVHVYRLSIDNSIEDWLKNIQKIKKSISNRIIDGKNDKTVEDIFEEKSINYDLFSKMVGLI